MTQEEIFKAIIKHRALVRGIVKQTVRKCCVRLPSDGLDDLTSEVCLNLAAKRMKTYRVDGGKSIKGWIAMSANCATLNVLRAYKYMVHYSTTDASPEDGAPAVCVVAADQSTPAERANAMMETELLKAAMAKLAPVDRELVEALATGAERAYQKRYGLSPTQMHRAKKRVRAILAKAIR